jgi:hypothetical protein
LVVVEIVSRSYSAQWNKKPSVSSAWHVGRRHTTPCATRQRIAVGHGYVDSNSCKLWRIVLRYLSAAEKLIGYEFATRAELESALENPAAFIASQAQGTPPMGESVDGYAVAAE